MMQIKVEQALQDCKRLSAILSSTLFQIVVSINQKTETENSLGFVIYSGQLSCSHRKRRSYGWHVGTGHSRGVHDHSRFCSRSWLLHKER